MNKTKIITICAMAITINVIGSFIGVYIPFPSPLYLDTIGTLTVSFLFGPLYGVITGIASNLIIGLAFDSYALYFMPVQILIGFLSGILYKYKLLDKSKIVLGVFLLTIIPSLVGSCIAGYVFGGFTSSPSSLIVPILKKIGFGTISSVFIVQIITDYIDKFITTLFALSIVSAIPYSLRKSSN